MPSLNDIPPEFLPVSAGQKFINWLKEMPLDNYIKLELALRWQRYNSVQWTKEEYNNAGLTQ